MGETSLNNGLIRRVLLLGVSAVLSFQISHSLFKGELCTTDSCPITGREMLIKSK